MSMREYGISEYGLVLGEDIVRSMIFALDDSITSEEKDDPYFDIFDCIDILDCVGVCYISEFSGEAIDMRADGTDIVTESKHYWGDVIFYVPTEKYPSIFKRAYRDFSELVKEFKVKLTKTGLISCLPGGFDIRNNIRHIVGTYSV